MFWKKNNTTYDIIEHLYPCKQMSESSITFTPYKNIEKIFISTNKERLGGYNAPYIVQNIIIIPINIIIQNLMIVNI